MVRRSRYPTFVGLPSTTTRGKVTLQGGSWPLLPVVLRHHQFFWARRPDSGGAGFPPEAQPGTSAALRNPPRISSSAFQCAATALAQAASARCSSARGLRAVGEAREVDADVLVGAGGGGARDLGAGAGVGARGLQADRWPTSRHSSITSGHASSTPSGTSIAPDGGVGDRRLAGRLLLGRRPWAGASPRAGRSNAAVSASTAASSRSLSSCPRTAIALEPVVAALEPLLGVREVGDHRGERRRRARRPAPRPSRRPGAGESADSSSANARSVIATRRRRLGQPVLDDALGGVERLDLGEAEGAHRDVDERALGHAGGAAHPREVVPAGREQRRLGHKPDELRAGHAQPALAGALVAGVERHVQRRDVEVGEVHRDLRAAELRDRPPDRLHRLEDARIPHRVARRRPATGLPCSSRRMRPFSRTSRATRLASRLSSVLRLTL